MAEGFARAYGGDVLIAASAGLVPAIGGAATRCAPWTRRTSICATISQRRSATWPRAEFDLVVNMSGYVPAPAFEE